MKGFINDSGNFVSNIVKIFMYLKTKKDTETLRTPTKTSYVLKSYDSAADNIRDKRLTAFFKVFIVVFGILFAISLLGFFADSGSHAKSYNIFGGYTWSAVCFFGAFMFFVGDMHWLFLSLKNRSFSNLDKEAKNSLFFYLVPCLIAVCLIALGGIILFLFG